MRLIDADALPRHGNRGGLVHWKDIEVAPNIETKQIKYFDEDEKVWKIGNVIVEANQTERREP